MKIQNLPSEIADMARHALNEVESTLEHGREAIVDKTDEGLSSMSSMFDKGARRVHALRSVVLAYASLRALSAALDQAGLGRRMLGSVGLQRRPSSLARAATGAGILVAGAAVGAGVALLLAPHSGARTRVKIARRFMSVRHDAEGVVHEVETAARDAVHAVESRARDVAHEVNVATHSVVADSSKAPSSTPPDGAGRTRARSADGAHRSPRTR